ncbi:MAG: 2-nitropropane dioxygenase [Gemmatimonadetes bacterium]|jgi:NAD(P)H-dependent flavin oxidoreductase YrpB (nitropropane dioxygenase family)|nr:2-nitropropane dioxygenase [Gemmatimonadota bacterium]
MSLPTIIQGGMGVGVSGWRLARAVSKAGQLGVVSGTCLDLVMTRRLQVGDPGGHIRRALGHFPIPDVAQRILDRHFVPEGLQKKRPFGSKPMPAMRPGRHLAELLVTSNFVEIFLAREGHRGPVGINYLEKVQLPTLPSLYGAMLAGAAWILMGAGIPKTIPGVIDLLADGQPVELKMDVRGAARDEDFFTRFDPQEFSEGTVAPIERPKFVPIVSSATLASMLAKKSTGRIDGFVVEGPTAGGHNAPPRGRMQLCEEGAPVYGRRDVPDLQAIGALGLPFWLAGSWADPESVAEARQAGAAGVQVGTAFAYAEESDLDPELKARVLSASRAGQAKVFTDPVASPTGFPFKVMQMEDTLSDGVAYENRTRVCDLGYLRHAYKTPGGSVGWRCPAEPVEDYVQKGGDAADTHGRVCLCNALFANIGLAQLRADGGREMPFVTSGDDVATVARFLPPGAESYRAKEVIESLLKPVRTPDLG